MRISYAIVVLVFGAFLINTVISLNTSDKGVSGRFFDGRPRVIDGDGLEIGGLALRLHGIDAPEMGQLCSGPQGQVDCGATPAGRMLGGS